MSDNHKLLGNLWVGNYRDPREVLSVFKKLVLPFIERDRIFYATRIGLGNDIPYGPGKEWVQWLYVSLHVASSLLSISSYHSLSPRCAQSTPHTQRITKELDKPYLFIGFEDDPLCLKCVTRPSRIYLELPSGILTCETGDSWRLKCLISPMRMGSRHPSGLTRLSRTHHGPCAGISIPS